MKDKILHLKDRLVKFVTENKKASAIVAVVLVAVIVVAVAAFGSGKGSQASKNNESQLKNDSSVADGNNNGDNNSEDNKSTDKDNKKETTKGEKESETKNDETTADGDKNEQDDRQSDADKNSSDHSGNKSNSGNNNSAGNGNSSNNHSDGNGNSGNNANTSNGSGNNSGNTSNSGTNNNVNNSGNGNNNSSNNNSNTTNNNSSNNNSNNNNNTNTNNNANNSNNNNNSSSNNNSNSGNNSTPANTNTSSGTDTPQPNQETIYNQLFDINNKVTITLDIPDSEIQKLENDYKSYGNGKSPIYRRVTKMTVTINNTSYDIYDVGVKMKGNTSRCDVYNSGDVNNRNLIHMKLSFDEAFDNADYYGSEALSWTEAARKERKSRTFATLDGLEIKWNRNFDGTYVANYYANQMYRAMGVYAQNTSLANVRFGGYNYGVYTIYEPVNSKFLKRYLGSKDGDLYKCGWSKIGASYTKGSLNSVGVETPSNQLTYDLKTNKSSSNHASLKNLINQLNSSPSKETFASLVDTNNWVMFAAVSYFAGNPDDLRNNFNNHYVYFNNGKAVFIPYDYDRCFGITTSGKDMTTFSPYADNTALQGNQSNPLYLYSITGRSNNYTTEYTEALKKVANSGWLNYSNYQKYYNIARNNYSSVAIPDSNVHVYVKEFGSNRGQNYNSSALSFAESNSYNTSVSNYITKIMQAYNTAMAKWN